jgi:hypothetical protein
MDDGFFFISFDDYFENLETTTINVDVSKMHHSYFLRLNDDHV